MHNRVIRQRLWLPALVMMLVVAAGCGSDDGSPDTASEGSSGNAENAPRGVLLSDPVEAPEFVLTDHTGEPFRLSSQRGNAVAIFFGYTGCPDVCPLTLSFMAHAADELGEQAEDITFLLITVDPEGDDPEKLDRYISRIDAPLVALTGTRSELERVWNSYDIAVERHDREDGTYLIDHSAQIWLVDPDGELMMFLPMGSDGDDLTADLRWLLNREL